MTKVRGRGVAAVGGSMEVASGDNGPPKGMIVPPGRTNFEEPKWLRRTKATVPDRVSGYVDRAGLVSRTMPTNQRLTLLQAAGGFGKTTLLAECCRILIDDGIPVAWLSLDEQDTAQVLDTYVAFAFEQAGVDIAGSLPSSELHHESASQHGANLVLRAIEAQESPCVLALDELERLADTDSVALLNFLLRWGPSNLHVAMACRELPSGLDVADLVLDGSALVVSANELRFSNPDIARFFGLKLSRRELRALTAESAGWPVALRIRRNEQRLGRNGDQTASEAGVVRDVVDNWIEARLWYGLSATDRDFLLDMGLCEWLDAELLDEVLESPDAMRRIETMPVLVGLLEPVGRGESVAWRLHPLIREHCVKQRFRETPDRYRAIHRRIAMALARRGETVDAMRHAGEAGDTALVGSILVQAGGLRLWLRDGLVLLQAADRFLTGTMIARDHRLALVRCTVLALTGRVAQARRLYEATGPLVFVSDAHGDDFAQRIDHILVRGLLVIYGCEGLGTHRARAPFADARVAVDAAGLDSLIRGTLEYGLCLAHSLKAEFDLAKWRAERARACLGRTSPYLTLHIDLQVGAVAMAQGRVDDAVRWYARGQRVAKTQFLRDPSVTAHADVLAKELDLERHRVTQLGGALRVAKKLGDVCTQYYAYAAASGLVAELSLSIGGVDAALAALDEIQERAYRDELPALSRYLSALRVGILAGAGDVGEAERTWLLDELPEGEDGCLDLSTQTWREMEALSCARLRLMAAREEYDEARRFAEAIADVASQRGLRRTWMRVVAQWMALEQRAGEERAAVGCLKKFLDVFRDTDYLRPLVREGATSVAVLTSYLDRERDTEARTTAESVLAVLQRTGGRSDGPPELTGREAEVLVRLENQRDKEIAAALGLTLSGVRYHITNILAKLSARGRMDAVHRARRLGLLP